MGDFSGCDGTCRERDLVKGAGLGKGVLTLMLLQDKYLKTSQWDMEFGNLGDAGV